MQWNEPSWHSGHRGRNVTANLEKIHPFKGREPELRLPLKRLPAPKQPGEVVSRAQRSRHMEMTTAVGEGTTLHLQLAPGPGSVSHTVSQACKSQALPRLTGFHQCHRKLLRSEFLQGSPKGQFHEASIRHRLQ